MKATGFDIRIRGTFALAVLCLCACAAMPAAAAAFRATSYTGSLQVLETPLAGPRTPGAPGTPQLQAGAHPDFSVSADFATKMVKGEGLPEQNEEFPTPDGNLRNFIGYGPPGLVGDPTNVPTCGFDCPEGQVGWVEFPYYGFYGDELTEEPLFNAEPPPGVVAEFETRFTGLVPLFIDAKVVNRGGTYVIALFSRGISEALPVGGFRVTLWGVPASSEHEPRRFGTYSSAPKLPFISNPTSCPGTPLLFDGASATSYQGETISVPPFSSDEFGRPLVITGCEKVPFEPSFTARPTTTSADSPTGLEATVTVPQNENPNGLSTAHLRDAVIKLPAGMTINSAAANGLGSCSVEAVNLDGEEPATCPRNSQLGTVSIDTPVLDHPLEGEVFLARQRENKFGSLLGLYLTIDDPASGIVLKLPGEIEADSAGNLTASFTENPQLPFETLKLSLPGGSLAPLRTPPTCGTYTSTGTFTPWSGTAPKQSTDSFQITSGPGGGACPNGGFDPSFDAGSTNPLAGEASPFKLEISRADGTQGLASLTATLPQGVLAKLAGVPYCPETALAAIPTAEGTGAAQLASPSCPAASEVGKVSVNVGAGSSPFEVATGRAYLAGPYKGAPLSLAVVTPAVAGPFDLGNVVTRVALGVDPTTTQVTAVSDPLPSVLDGIPLDLRRVTVNLDKPDFTTTPTSCEATAVTAQIVGLAGAVANRQTPYRVAECASLGFSPKLALSYSGATKRGGDPAVKATLTPRAGDANASRVQVLLPKSSFIDQSHIGNPCTRVQFDAGNCPASSVLGTAKAYSPLLAEPLTGPVYFRSNGGERQLPDLVADLNGQIHVVLVGFIDSKKQGGSSRVRATFATVPDAPVSSFTLSLKGGKRGLIENSADLCEGKQVATVRAVAHSGKVASFGTQVEAVGCGARLKDKKKPEG